MAPFPPDCPAGKSAGKSPLRSLIGFSAAALIAALICWLMQGRAGVQLAAESSARQLVDLLAELVLGLIIAAALSELVPRQRVARLLGKDSGLAGVGLATVLGMAVPGGPPAIFPLVLGLQRAGADIGALVAFLSAWASISLSRVLIWEIPLLGADFAIERLLIGLPIPLLAGLAARRLLPLVDLRKSRNVDPA